jgi:hypothetical protein
MTAVNFVLTNFGKCCIIGGVQSTISVRFITVNGGVIMKCVKCGEKIRESSNFCFKCGAKTVKEYCTYCGSTLEQFANFCSVCGTNVPRQRENYPADQNLVTQSAEYGYYNEANNNPDGYAAQSDTSDFKYETNNNSIVLKSYWGYEDDLEIPVSIGGLPVEELGENVFESKTTLHSVILPATVEKIGSFAFGNCSGLEMIILPESLSEISMRAFYGCKSLKEIVLPESLENIGENAFGECASVTEIVIPSALKRINRKVFQGCLSLSKVIMPRTLEEIEEMAFDSTAITSIVIPEGVKEIPDFTFSGCGKLQEIYFPSTLENISHNAFVGCTNLRRAIFPKKTSPLLKNLDFKKIFKDCKNIKAVSS